MSSTRDSRVVSYGYAHELTIADRTLLERTWNETILHGEAPVSAHFVTVDRILTQLFLDA